MTETITLAGGCFWCTEAVFATLAGVEHVQSGYTGGDVPNPTYQQVCTGETGHAEAVEIEFDPAVLPLADLLRVFFSMHDPTTLNRQGADVGTEYRSAIFYRTPEQKAVAETVIQELEAEEIWDDPIVTSLEPFSAFYPAEEYHQEFYERNENSPYCQVIIAPKLAAVRRKYQKLLKEEA